MSSEVDICNEALGNLGDDALITSISPPDGSVQALRCSRLYPSARNALLEMHQWGFATKRVALSLLSITPPSQWTYAYAVPSDMLNAISVLDPNSTDDSSYDVPLPDTYPTAVNTGLGIFTPAAFVLEAAPDGTDVLYSDLQYAMLRYTGLVTDVAKYTPLFREALIAILTSKLAGPTLKGATGMKVAVEWMNAAVGTGGFVDRAQQSDANQRRVRPVPSTPWLVNRN